MVNFLSHGIAFVTFIHIPRRHFLGFKHSLFDTEFVVSDTLVLEFNQYTPDSRWRKTTISRKYHREEGNEADGFYGGIRKIKNENEISVWKNLWPSEVLD